MAMNATEKNKAEKRNSESQYLGVVIEHHIGRVGLNWQVLFEKQPKGLREHAMNTYEARALQARGSADVKGPDAGACFKFEAWQGGQ